MASVRAISVTHCGELGFVLYIPNEVANYVYEKIVEAGEEYGLTHVGYLALRHLRIEKFYVYWGQDINSTVTPIQAGRLFRVDFEVFLSCSYT
jgi:glycine cleavage system aminomethyltransferase T